MQGLNFTFQQLFQYPTIEGLIQHSHETAPDDVVPHEFLPFEMLKEEDRKKIPAGISDAYPMSMLQSGLVYQSEIMQSSRSYHDIVSHLIQAPINLDLFKKAVKVLVDQNPVFRTSYHLKEFSENLQLVHENVDELPLLVVDIRHLKSEAEHEAWYQQWVLDEQNHAFSWEKPGLVRLHIHLMRDNLYRYCISQHNSALDGWSMTLIHTKLFELYYSMLKDEKLESLPVENHLRNFIGLEQYSINSKEHIKFWHDYMNNRPRTKIPRLRPAQKEKEMEVVFHDVLITNELSDEVIKLAQRIGVPVKNVLLAAHLKFHSFICGEEDIITGYEHAGRPELPGADRAFGVFLNTIPFRVQVNDATWEDLIKQTYQAEAKVLPYRRYPMAKVKQDMQTTGELFETVFNFTRFMR